MAQKSYNNSFHYLPGSRTMVRVSSRDLFQNDDITAINIPGKYAQKYGKYVPWGEDNDLPDQVRKKVYKSEIVASNLFFNILVGYGGGIEFGKIVKDEKGIQTIDPNVNFPEVQEFFDQNDMGLYLLQACTNMAGYLLSFAELGLNNKRKAVSLLAKETSFSRLSEQDAQGMIKYHLYSAKWADSAGEDDIDINPLLNMMNPVRDALIRVGKIPDYNGKTQDLKERRLIVPCFIPTIGGPYYPKPYWWSIFESGWFDYAIKIPLFKDRLLTNQVVIKYHIQISEDYFEDIFAEEGITDEKKQADRMAKEYKQLDKFLSDPNSTGKSVTSKFKMLPDGKIHPKIKIETLENPLKGGEFIEDSEEASNIQSYAMGVHPSIVGAALGKGTINGTETRELFIMQQAMKKPVRDRILMPLYVAKAINNWPKEVGFAISNTVLTTLDKGTGSEKKIT